MEYEGKNHAIKLGIRIGITFLFTLCILILVAYYALSQNLHTNLTDYTIKLVQAMVNQGVTTVEYELQAGRDEVAVLANSVHVSEGSNQIVEFPAQIVTESRELRMVYVSERGTVASDGRQRDISNRPDIIEAYHGEISVYGPYYNEEQEYVICYSAPIKRAGKIVGVLSIEKDGYYFCDLIESIRFVDSGESYIINSRGTDIAVSDQEHIDWVKEEYNARELLKESENEETRSVLELEDRGLNGESGVGTYYWNGGLCYVIYKPIPSENWVLLAGLREEEIAAMTQSTLFSAISKGPVLSICILAFVLLTGVILYWIISNMKKSTEINEKLEIIANHDALTGLLNRRFLEAGLSEMWKYPIKVTSQAAVFMIDIDNFKKYNDFFGHPQGDTCLCHIASVLKGVFDGYVIRYGGEEFIAVVFSVGLQAAKELGEEACHRTEGEAIPDGRGGVVTVSVGVCHVVSTLNISLNECINIADNALHQAKNSGKNRVVILPVQ